MLAILEYNAGNQTSVKRALDFLGIPAVITDDPAKAASCSGVIFPGVGSAAQAMEQLRMKGLDRALKDLVAEGRPLLGICVGCQILLEASAEGPTQTLGIEKGECRKFPAGLADESGNPLKIPHMGWNSVKRTTQSRLWKNIPDAAEFYFVHSYYPCPQPGLALAKTKHGIEFCSAFGRDGLWAVQFHPEKSGRHGLTLLENFHSYCKEQEQCSPAG